ncbi:metal-dependent hydrolase family protein [Siphonobacter curvatus]|uniref:Amidohydrolase n=1 Tax=Siphonobacter curvatus TaxID=2094562 RepID=A0A2S7IL60_9BACT|nr:amidohydrolase family protein [Siphonobacter curvatus]PQA58457.1 amidohydrolase [Siphonobacter curvatus]
MFRKLLALLFLTTSLSQAQSSFVLIPDRVFDGTDVHTGWQVLVTGNQIIAVGPNLQPPAGAEVIVLKNQTLLPGLIEGHSHLFLHPYNETSWDDQVLRESPMERAARAVVHAEKTLLAGFTTVRDLGTEGADFDDVGLKQTIEKGIIPGPRMITVGRALIATGSYGPKGYNTRTNVPQGAEEADGQDRLIQAVRGQIGRGIDVVKIYADYRWGLMGEAKPTFLQEEIELMVKVAASSGRSVIAHASTEEGIRRAILGGCKTIEHGDVGTLELFRLMKSKGVAYCPTLAASDAISQYRGWKKGQDSEPERIVQKRKSFKAALESGVTIVMGGDVGVFTHGDNVREMELMQEYGMKPLDVLRSATSVPAQVFGQPKLGEVKTGKFADLIAVEGDPTQKITHLRKVKLVMKDGKLYKR